MLLGTRTTDTGCFGMFLGVSWGKCLILGHRAVVGRVGPGYMNPTIVWFDRTGVDRTPAIGGLVRDPGPCLRPEFGSRQFSSPRFGVLCLDKAF